MKKRIILPIVILLIVISIVYLSQDKSTNSLKESASINTEESSVIKNEEILMAQSWQEIELKDIARGSNFKISDFNDKPVLLESFAVWCPSCRKQQENVKALHEELGDSFISIALATDPSESEEKVRGHIEENGFDWYYAIATKEITNSLIDEFGSGIVSAPSVPMVLICPDGNYRKLGIGTKSVQTLKDELGKC